MPQVGDKHFPYTEAGYAAAANARGKGYNEGGLARSRRNHKGCGCVMEGRRKKTLHT